MEHGHIAKFYISFCQVLMSNFYNNKQSNHQWSTTWNGLNNYILNSHYILITFLD